MALHTHTDSARWRQSFTPLQSRSLPHPISCVSNLSALCPSMDLIALGLGSSRGGEGVSIHRTVSWQRLLNISCSDLSSSSNSSNEVSGATSCLCWSPDGRAIAIGLADGCVMIYLVEDGGASSLIHSIRCRRVESVAQPPVPSPAVTRSRAARRAREAKQGRVEGGVDGGDRSVVGLAWARMAKHPESWDAGEEEEEDLAWSFQCRYLDRAEHFLPHVQGEEHDSPSTHTPMPVSQYIRLSPISAISNDRCAANTESSFTSTAVTKPSSRTPLSVLCVAYSSGDIHLYLHGRYLIAQILPPANLNFSSSTTQIVFTSDLTSFLTSTAHSLTLHSVPPLHTHRHTLQELSSLYTSITAQLQTASTSLASASSQWKDALRPLEMKLSSLRELLRDYGLSETSSPRAELLHMILSGAGTKHRQGGNDAMVQFFGSGMSELSLNRIAKNVETGAASVERLIRTSIKEPAMAVSYAASELYALASASKIWEYDESLIGPDVALEMQKASEVLCVVTEHCLSRVVEVRHRLRDFMCWMTGTLASVKAQGAAPNSFERENAKRKRPSQAVIRRVISFLSEGDHRQMKEPLGVLGVADKQQQISECESVLGVSISDYFHKQNVHILRRGTSFSSSDILSEAEWQEDTILSIRTALQVTEQLSSQLFAQPCDHITETVNRINIRFPQSFSSSSSSPPPSSIHKRIGVLHEHSGGFRPRLLPLPFEENNDYRSRHWILIARPTRKHFIQLFAFPEENTSEFYLRGVLQLPSQCTLKEIAFYGDDGNSSLSSGEHAKLEGRQSMVVLVENAQNDEKEISEELWMFSYDEINFCVVKGVVGDMVELKEENVDDDLVAKVFVTEEEYQEEEGRDVTLFARRRQLRIINDVHPAMLNDRRLLVSGSRGIGGVVTNDCMLCLFDLEEDEEGDESDEGEEEDEEEENGSENDDLSL